MQAEIWGKFCFTKKMGKIAQNGQKMVIFTKFYYQFFLEIILNEKSYFFIWLQILYLPKVWFISYGPKCSWPIILQDSLISQERSEWSSWFFTCRYRKCRKFPKGDAITLMGVARQAQSTPNKQFAIPYTFQKRDER